MVSVVELRQRLEAQLVADLVTSDAATTWHRSSYSADRLGADVRAVVHRVFAVGVGKSEVVDARRRRGEGNLVDTELTVRWAWRLRSDGQQADDDEALAGEERLIAAVLGTSQVSTSGLVLMSLEREVRELAPPGDEGPGKVFRVGTIRVNVRHRYAVPAP